MWHIRGYAHTHTRSRRITWLSPLKALALLRGDTKFGGRVVVATAAAAAVEEEGGMLPLPTPLAATVAERWPSELVEWDGPLQRAQRAVAEAVGIMARPVLELGRALLDAAPRATQAPT